MAKKRKGNATRIDPKADVIPEHVADVMFPITDYVSKPDGEVVQKSLADVTKAKSFVDHNEK